MKRDFFLFKNILTCITLNLLSIDLFAAHEMVRREAAQEATSMMRSGVKYLPKRMQTYMWPSEQPRMSELRTEVSDARISKLARQHQPEVQSPVAFHHFEQQHLLKPQRHDVSIVSRVQTPVSDALVWRQNLPSEQQARVKQIYEEMSTLEQQRFSDLSDVDQISFMQNKLESFNKEVSVPTAKSSGTGMMNLVRGKKSAVNWHSGSVGMSILPKSVVNPPRENVSLDVSGDMFTATNSAESVLSRQDRDILKGLDLSKITDLPRSDDLASKPSTSQKSFNIEKHVTEFKELLVREHMPSELADTALEGIKNYLVKSKQAGTSEVIAVKKVQDFLDLEFELGDEDYQGGDDLIAREQEVQDVFIPVKQAFINNFDQLLRTELKVMDLPGFQEESISISDEQRAVLERAQTFQDFIKAYEKMKQLVINDVMMRQSTQFLQSLKLNDAEKMIVREAVQTELKNIVDLDVPVSKQWQKLSDYGQKLQQYFVENPVGRTVDNTFDMPSDLVKVVNEWRLNTFETQLREKLTELGASSKTIDQTLDEIKTELLDQDITVTQTPSIVFDHIQMLTKDLLAAQIEDLVQETARIAQQEAEAAREAQEKLLKDAASKATSADKVHVVSKPDMSSSVRHGGGRRQSPSSDFPTSVNNLRLASETKPTEVVVTPVQRSTIKVPKGYKPHTKVSVPQMSEPSSVAHRKAGHDQVRAQLEELQPQKTSKEFNSEVSHAERIPEVTRTDSVDHVVRRVPSGSDLPAAASPLRLAPGIKRAEVVVEPVQRPAIELPEGYKPHTEVHARQMPKSSSVTHRKAGHDQVRTQLEELQPQKTSEEFNTVISPAERISEMTRTDSADHVVRRVSSGSDLPAAASPLRPAPGIKRAEVVVEPVQRSAIELPEGYKPHTKVHAPQMPKLSSVARRRVDHQSKVMNSNERGRTPQEISGEDTRAVVQKGVEPQTQLVQAESGTRNEVATFEARAHQQLRQQMSELIGEVHRGQVQQVMKTESDLRSELFTLQQENINAVRDMFNRETVTMRQAELLMKQKEEQLSKMLKEMFAQQVTEYEASIAHALTQQQERFIAEIEAKFQKELAAKFELAIKTLENLEQSHRSDIVHDHETSSESIYEQMQQEYAEALKRTIERQQEQKEAEERERQQQELDHRRVQQEIERRERQQQESEPRTAQTEVERDATTAAHVWGGDEMHQTEGEPENVKSAQDAYESSVNEFNRLHAAILILFQQLDQGYVEVSQAEQESRDLLHNAMLSILQNAQYQAQTQAQQALYEKKMHELYQQEGEKILDDIDKERERVIEAREELTRSQKAHSVEVQPSKDHHGSAEHTSGGDVKFHRDQKDSSRTAKQRVNEKDVSGVELHPVEPGTSTQGKGEHAKLRQKEEEEQFLHELEERVQELIETAKEAHSTHHSGEHSHDVHPHGHDHDGQHDDHHKEPKEKEPKKISPTSSDSNIDTTTMRQLAMSIAEKMFAVRQEKVTTATIAPWIKKDAVYKKLKLSNPKNMQYLAGYAQSCMIIIENKEEVLALQKQEIQLQGLSIARKLLAQNVNVLSEEQFKNIVQDQDNLKAIDPENPYAMNWARGYLQAKIELLSDKRLR